MKLSDQRVLRLNAGEFEHEPVGTGISLLNGEADAAGAIFRMFFPEFETNGQERRRPGVGLRSCDLSQLKYSCHAMASCADSLSPFQQLT